MSQSIMEFELKLQEIKQKLGEFVQDNGIKVKMRSSGDVDFQCLNPDHPDNNPSMYIGSQVPHIAHCRSCGVSYNIFQANNILTQAPLFGLAFIEKNVNKLALQYGIEPIDLTQIDESVLVKLRAQNIHDVASQLLASSNKASSMFITDEYALKVGVSKEVVKTMRVGTVLDTKQFFDAIKKEGNWTSQDLEESGLKHWLFGAEKLTYTIFNNYGMPVAFAARNLDFDGKFGVAQNPKQERKWINSSMSIIYDKSECLYGIHIAKKELNSKVYIFEGYSDVCVAHSNDIKNAVCIGGVSFSPAHVKMLADAEFSVAIIALDGDEAGLKAVDSILDKGFSEIQGIKPTVLIIPSTVKNDGSGDVDSDPDTYIKTFGANAFQSLKPKSAFKYVIDRIPDKLDSADHKTAFMNRFLPIIMNETSSVTQEEMRKDIAYRIGVSTELIKETQHRIEVQKDHKNREGIRRYSKKFFKELNDALDLYPDKITSVTASFNDYVNSLLDGERYLAFGHQEVEDGVATWWDSLQKTNIDTIFWKTGWKFWDETIGGIKKQGNFTGITGAANIGKSAFLTNLALGVLMNNDPDELLLLYWTIDDPREELLTKMVAAQTCLPISSVCNYSKLGNDKQKEIKKAHNRIKDWITKHRCLSIKDMSIGSSADDLAKWVDQEISKQPNKKPLVIIDNFANMSSAASGNDMDTQITNINKLHKLRAERNIALVSSFEVNKEGTETRAGAKSVYGSGKITYRLTMNLMLFNEVDIARTQNLNNKNIFQYWIDSMGIERPVLELSIIKTKMTFKDATFRGKITFRFVNHVGLVQEIGDLESLKFFIDSNKNVKSNSLVESFAWDSIRKCLPSVNNRITANTKANNKVLSTAIAIDDDDEEIKKTLKGTELTSLSLIDNPL